ncbi:MAG: mannose-1-phosphate guanylyltransferase [Pseudohongiellaceae bacterium]
MRVPQQAIVLAAGEGRRLRPFTAHTPKPLVPFLNRPLLQGTLEELEQAGVQRVWLNGFHLAEQLLAWASTWQSDTLEVTVVVEEQLLGTGGGLANIAPRLAPEPVLVLAGDVVADFDFEALTQRHLCSGAEATMALTTAADPQQFGPVALDERDMVCDIIGRQNRPGCRSLVNASAHVLEPRFLARLPSAGVSCFVRDGYLPALGDDAAIAGWVHPGAWAETGTPEALLSAQRAALNGSLPVSAHRLTAGGRQLGDQALIHPTATVAQGVECSGGSTVGAAAHIGHGVIIRQCLVASGVCLPDHTTWENQIIDSQDTVEQLLAEQHGAALG